MFNVGFEGGGGGEFLGIEMDGMGWNIVMNFLGVKRCLWMVGWFIWTRT